MSGDLLSRRELAARAGVTRQALEKRLRSGHLSEVEGPDGRRGFDPDGPDVLAYIASAKKPRLMAQRQRQASAPPRDTTLPPRGELGGDKLRPPSGLAASLASVDDLPDDANLLDMAKTRAQIRHLDLGTELKRDRYIARGLVLGFFARWLAIDESELRTLGDRIAPSLAAEARRAETEDEATIALARLISEETHRALAHRKRRMRELRAEVKELDQEAAAHE